LDKKGVIAADSLLPDYLVPGACGHVDVARSRPGRGFRAGQARINGTTGCGDKNRVKPKTGSE